MAEHNGEPDDRGTPGAIDHECVAEGWFRLRSAALGWVMPSGGKALSFQFNRGAERVVAEAAVDTADGGPIRPGGMFLDARLTFDAVDACGAVVPGAVFHVVFGEREVGQGAITRVLRSS